MFKRKNLLLIISLSLIGILLFGFLTVGKCTEITILDKENNKTSYLICKGELVSLSGTINSNKDVYTKDLLEKGLPTDNVYTYFNNNVFNKGYSNNEAVSMIKNYLEP